MMKQRLIAALIALVLFGGGLFLGYRFAWECPLPPVPPMGGFGPGPGPRPEPPGPPPVHPTPEQAAALKTEIDSLQPQLEAFQKGFDALEADFHTHFTALLTPEQREKMQAHHEEEVDWVGDFNQMAAERTGQPPVPGSHDSHHLLMHVMRIIMYTPTLHIWTDRFSLTAAQQAALGRLLEARRQAFLRLVQEHPLPYDQLYMTVRRLGLLPPR